MTTNPSGINNNVANKQALERIQAAQYDNLLVILNNSLKCNIALTTTQFEFLEKKFEPLKITLVPPQHRVEHPIAQFYNHYGNKRCLEVANKFERSIAIGGNPIATPNANHHLCYLDDNMKTSSRAVSNAFKQINTKHNKIDFTDYFADKSSLCLNGAHKCYYKAPYAHSSNVYDIQPYQIADIFINHHLIVWDMWMFLPIQLVDEKFSADEEIYNYSTYTEKGEKRCRFHLHDHSHVYNHSYENWRFYATFTNIKCSNFGITLEIIESIGTYSNIRLIRTELINGTIEKIFPLSKMVEKIAIPNLNTYIRKRFTSDPYADVIQLPHGFVKRAIGWATSAIDEQFKFNNFSVHMNSIKTDIRYANNSVHEVVYNGIDPDPELYEDIKISLFIITAVMRYHRTQDLSALMNYMKSHTYTRTGFFSMFSKQWQKFKFAIRTAIMTIPNYTDSHIDVNERFIYDISVKLPEDQIHSSFLKLERFAIFPKRVKYYHFERTNTDSKLYTEDDLPHDSYPIKTDDHTDDTRQHALPSAPPASIIKPVTASAPTSSTDASYSSDDLKKILRPDGKKIHTAGSPSLPSLATAPFESNILCEKTIFNPKGDGLCGLHCLQHDRPEKIIVPDKYTCGGITTIMPKNWFNDEHLYFIAKHNRINIRIHLFGVITHTNIFGDGPYLNINLDNQHWTIVECKCKPGRSYVGDYIDLPEDAKYIYVNCANNQLADGAGQALAFKTKFPNYSAKISKPIQNFHTIVHNGFTCALVVAYNNRGKPDLHATNTRLHEIFTKLKALSDSTNKTVFLPLIGTALFGGNVCCFKTILSKYKFKHILTFLTAEQEKKYHEYKPCKHGGFIQLTNANETNVIDDEHPSDHSKLIERTYDKNRMRYKLCDVLHACDYRKRTTIYDLSCAPGTWLEFYATLIKEDTTIPPYEAFAYNGVGCFKVYDHLHKFVKSFYNNIDQIIHENVFKYNSLFIFDYMPSINVLRSLINLCIKYKATVVFKLDHYDDNDFANKIILLNSSAVYLKTIVSEFSNIKSSEVYYIINPGETDNEEDTFKTSDVLGAKQFFMREAGLEPLEPINNNRSFINEPIDRSLLEPSLPTSHKVVKFWGDIDNKTTQNDTIIEDDDLNNLEKELKAFEINETPETTLMLSQSDEDFMTTYEKEMEEDAIKYKPIQPPKKKIKTSEILSYDFESVIVDPDQSSSSSSPIEKMTTIIETNEPETDLNVLLYNFADKSDAQPDPIKDTPNDQPIAEVDTKKEKAELLKQQQKLIDNINKKENNNTPPTIEIVDEKIVTKCKCKHNWNHRINCDVTFQFKPKPEDLINELLLSFKKIVELNDEQITKLSQTIRECSNQIVVPCCNGIAGGRKSRTFIENSCPKCAIIIAPFSNVIADVKDIKANTHQVFVKALLSGRSFDYIILDEIFAIQPIYLSIISKLAIENNKNTKIFGLGDSEQITDRDYQAHGSLFSVKYKSNMSYETVTHRSPICVAELLHNYIPGCTTTSTEKGSITFDTVENIKKITQEKSSILLCATQKMKQYLQISHKCNVQTINAIQGSTRHTVHIYTPDINSISQDQIKYVYTAMTRATHRIILHGPESDNKKFLTILSSPMDRALLKFGVHVHSTSYVEKKVDKQPIHQTLVTHKCTIVQQSDVEAIFDRTMLPTNDNSTNIIAYKTDVIPQIISKEKFKCSPGMVTGNDINIKGRKFATKNYLLHYHPKDHTRLVSTVVGRYADEKRHVDSEMLDLYTKGLDKFMRKDWKKFIRHKQNGESEMHHLSLYLTQLQTKYPKDADYALLNSIIQEEEVIQTKSQFTSPLISISTNNKHKKLKTSIQYIFSAMLDGKPNKIDDLEKEWYESYHDLVQFHLKRQPKFVLEHGYDTLYKDGQGISAWSKLMNCIFASTTRHFSQWFRALALPNVQISYGQSDAELALFYSKFANQLNDKNFVKFMLDFKQFDRSQEEQGIIASGIMLHACGYRKETVDYYMSRRSSWTLASRSMGDGNEALSLMLRGTWQQHSGQPFTLDGNTIYNMAAVGMCYKIKGMVCGAFKGDDSFILCESITEKLKGTITHAQLCGFQLKPHIVNIAEYIANIITPQGAFFPDVLRRTSRVLSKVYTCESDWNEQRTSIIDCLDVIYDDQALYHGCQIASQFYAQFSIYITPQEVLTMVNFLYQISECLTIDDIPIKTWTIKSLNF